LTSGVSVVEVESAAEMLDAVQSAEANADALIMAAAVADYTPKAPTDVKLKKTQGELHLDLDRTADILDTIRGVPVRVGFAAETDDLIENAKGKLKAKGLDLVVANAVGGPESPFGADVDRASLVDRSNVEELPLLAKRELADRILDRIRDLLAAN